MRDEVTEERIREWVYHLSSVVRVNARCMPGAGSTYTYEGKEYIRYTWDVGSLRGWAPCTRSVTAPKGEGDVRCLLLVCCEVANPRYGQVASVSRAKDDEGGGPLGSRVFIDVVHNGVNEYLADREKYVGTVPYEVWIRTSRGFPLVWQ